VRPPRIAITAWRRELPTPLGERTPLYALDPAYAAAVAAAGGIPFVVTRDAPPAAALADMDGLVVSGGGDVAPASYGADDEGGCEDVDLEADAWELALIAEARRRRLPTLGICRGMQLLAVAHGGALAQGVPDPGLHPGMGALPPAESLARRHLVELDEGSAIAGALAASRLAVNTLHHQMVADAGTLTVVGRAEDGTVEALEAPDWPALGVLWHPEKMREPEQVGLFAHLVERARHSP
jgi:putative glutamine amidotransferase